MKLGIATRYGRCEATYVALRIADWVEQYGHDLAIFCTHGTPAEVYPHYDAAVQHAGTIRFTDWAKSCDAIVWTHCPDVAQIQWVAKQKIHTAIFLLCQDILPSNKEAVQTVNCIISGTQPAARYLSQRWKVKHSIYSGWDPGVPLTRKPPKLEMRGCRILWPLWDRIADVTESTALAVLRRSLADYPAMTVTVPLTPSNVTSYTRRQLRKLSREFPNRVQVLGDISYSERPILIREHQLLFWPVHHDNLGMIPLTSLAMGTPVITFAFSPLTEFLTVSNAICAKCTTKATGGFFLVEPDFVDLEDKLQTFLDDREMRHELQQHTLYGMQRRRSLFDEAIARGLMTGG